MVKEIPLTHDQVALVDDKDYVWLSQWEWKAHLIDGNWRPVRRLWIGNRMVVILMYRLMLDPKRNEYIHHINHDTLDNRRANLRVCTNAQNVAHQCPRKGGSSRFKGVCKTHGKWRAYIKVNWKQIHLGYFIDELKAARAYDQAAIQYFGEFAYTNALTNPDV